MVGGIVMDESLVKVDYSQDDIVNMINDTSELIANEQAEKMELAAVAAQSSNALTDNVEFWKWMGRNYSNSGIFDNSVSMNNYISKGIKKEEWVAKQLQGKGYEWDWMKTQRGKIQNITKTYDAGDVVNRAASDVTEKNILTGASKEYQMKAYTSKTNPDLKNTPKDMTVVTNSEKTAVVKKNGYENVEEYKNAKEITKDTQKRMEQIKNDKAYTTYNLTNVAGTMAKAGAIGFATGLGIEAIGSYKKWKAGQLSDEDYIKEIVKSGGDAGGTSGLTAGIMIPLSKLITVAGASTWITIPISFAITGAVNKIVAPCFGRGDYKKVLMNAKYYQDLEHAYGDLVASIQNASDQYYDFVVGVYNQTQNHEYMKMQSMSINKDLESLYDSI